MLHYHIFHWCAEKTPQKKKKKDIGEAKDKEKQEGLHTVYWYAKEGEGKRWKLKCNKLRFLFQNLQILHTNPLIWPMAAIKVHLVLRVTF